MCVVIFNTRYLQHKRHTFPHEIFPTGMCFDDFRINSCGIHLTHVGLNLPVR